jgi:hypothetical protein
MQAYRKLSLSIIAALLLVTVSSAAFPRLRDTYANLTGTQYLYPDAPIAIAEGIECKKIAPGSIGGAIKHAATAEIDYNNYRVLLYAKYSRSSFYELQERYVAEASGTYVQNTSTSLDKSGSFIIPGLKLYKDNEQNYLEGTIVALITNLDDGIVKRYPFSIIKSNDAALSMIRSIAGDCTAS